MVDGMVGGSIGGSICGSIGGNICGSIGGSIDGSLGGRHAGRQRGAVATAAGAKRHVFPAAKVPTQDPLNPVHGDSVAALAVAAAYVISVRVLDAKK